MAFVIAFAGKGGTGKTSLAGLVVKYLSPKGGGLSLPSTLTAMPV